MVKLSLWKLARVAAHVLQLNVLSQILELKSECLEYTSGEFVIFMLFFYGSVMSLSLSMYILLLGEGHCIECCNTFPQTCAIHKWTCTSNGKGLTDNNDLWTSNDFNFATFCHWRIACRSGWLGAQWPATQYVDIIMALRERVRNLPCCTPLQEECPKHHGHKGDLRVKPKTCSAIGEKAQVILVLMKALAIGNASHPQRLRVTRVRL